MKLYVLRLREQLRGSLWFIPAVCALVALGMGEIAVSVDKATAQQGAPTRAIFDVGIDGAREFLSVVAASMLTFTGLVFSITMLVLQTASSQMSPRVMRTFLRDRGTQLVLGIFIATFVFSLFVLGLVRSTGERDEFDPALSVQVAFVLVVASVAAFIFFINHMAKRIRPVAVMGAVAQETADAIERMYPQQFGDEPGRDDPPVMRPSTPYDIVPSDNPSGALQAVDEESVLGVACENSWVIEVLPVIGDFVRRGAPLFRVWNLRDDDPGGLGSLISTGQERTMEQDPLFGFRQLVDIAEKALSPGINDPTTAVQAIDHIHALLGRVLAREIPSAFRLDDEGDLRIIAARPSWDDFVHLAVDEIRQYGHTSVQVMRRLRFMLDDLLLAAPVSRKPVLEQQLLMLDEATAAGFASMSDRELARHASAQGHGPRSDRQIDEPQPEKV